MFLLDTNVVSELRKPRPHGAVLAWFDQVEESQLHLSAVTLGEIQAGIELTRQQDPGKATELEHWADQVAATYGVLPMDADAFRQWARGGGRRRSKSPKTGSASLATWCCGTPSRSFGDSQPESPAVQRISENGNQRIGEGCRQSTQITGDR